MNNTKTDELQMDSGAILSNPEEIANHLNKHFASIGSNLASTIPTEKESISPEHVLTVKDSSFSLKNIESSAVLKLLKKLNVAKATSIADKIANRILKIAAPIIYRSLTDIFNLSISSSVFPSEWKKAKVAPIFKSGGREDVNNYAIADNCASSCKAYL